MIEGIEEVIATFNVILAEMIKGIEEIIAALNVITAAVMQGIEKIIAIFVTSRSDIGITLWWQSLCQQC